MSGIATTTTHPLNRTILELKRRGRNLSFCQRHSLNRTILELKQRNPRHVFGYKAGFKSYHFGIETGKESDKNTPSYTLNRTILELKQPSPSYPIPTL